MDSYHYYSTLALNGKWKRVGAPAISIKVWIILVKIVSIQYYKVQKLLHTLCDRSRNKETELDEPTNPIIRKTLEFPWLVKRKVSEIISSKIMLKLDSIIDN